MAIVVYNPRGLTWCLCACHIMGSNVLHVTACCQLCGYQYLHADKSIDQERLQESIALVTELLPPEKPKASAISFTAPPVFDGKHGGDPEAGCGCGHNCDRNPGDPCPLEALEDRVLELGLTLEDILAAGVIPHARLRTTQTLPYMLWVMWENTGFNAAWHVLQSIAAVKEKH